MFRAEINSLAELTAMTIPELKTLDITFRCPAVDILVFFNHPVSSNGPPKPSTDASKNSAA